jgi:hypothetical protein
VARGTRPCVHVKPTVFKPCGYAYVRRRASTRPRGHTQRIRAYKTEDVACERGGLDIYCGCTYERAGVSSEEDGRGNERLARTCTSTSTSTSTSKQTAEHDCACGACSAHSALTAHARRRCRSMCWRPSVAGQRAAVFSGRHAGAGTAAHGRAREERGGVMSGV